MNSFQRLLPIFAFPLLFFSFKGNQASQKSLKQFEITGRAQGTTYSIKYIAASSKITKAEIDSLLLTLDQSLSLYSKTSLISRFNQSKKSIQTDHHLKTVVQLSQRLSLETNRAFDFTLKTISYLWGFQNTRQPKQPSNQRISRTLQWTGPDQLYFDNNMLIKKNKHVQIDCDGIAQGYSVDCISSLIKEKGIQDFMVELGGEVYAEGKNIKNECWSIALSYAYHFTSSTLDKSQVALCNQAITTSGKYSKSIQINQQQKSHIINPQNGKPLENNIRSVTVITENTAYADALDNAFMVMGMEKSWIWVEGKNIGIYFIYQTPEGKLADTCNSYFKRFLK